MNFAACAERSVPPPVEETRVERDDDDVGEDIAMTEELALSSDCRPS